MPEDEAGSVIMTKKRNSGAANAPIPITKLFIGIAGLIQIPLTVMVGGYRA